MSEDRKNSLLVEQAIAISDLQEQKREFIECLKNMRVSLVCIGGPLNDNALKFNNGQRNFLLKKILDKINYALDAVGE